MKILHTSDWHLGQEFYSYSREVEHLSFFKQLGEIVVSEKPDVMVVSGDIYHNGTPSNSVMKMFTDQLEKICLLYPQMQVVITAGNHDSSSRLEVNSALWKHLNVSVIGKLNRVEGKVNFKHHMIPIKGANNKKCGYVLALPHIFMGSYPCMTEDTSGEERLKDFYKILAEFVESENKENLPVVMMSHMAISGSDVTGHNDVRGGMEYINIADLKVKYDYLALGHIHCPQDINDKHARYCGSPIPVSFDENYVHSVTIVDVDKRGAEPKLKHIRIENPIPLKTIPKEAVSFNDAIAELRNFPDKEEGYIRLHVKLDDVAPVNALETANNIVQNKKCRFCCFKWEKHEKDNTSHKTTFEDVEQLKETPPIDIAKMYYREQFKKDMDSELLSKMQYVINKLAQNN